MNKITMTSDFFDSQIARLNENFRNYFTTSRKAAIWQVVQSLSAYEFQKFIDKAIWWEKAPTLEQFANVVRNQGTFKTWEVEKQEINRGLQKIFTNENIREMNEMLKKKLDGKISKEEFNTYLEIMKTAGAK